MKMSQNNPAKYEVRVKQYFLFSPGHKWQFDTLIMTSILKTHQLTAVIRGS